MESLAKGGFSSTAETRPWPIIPKPRGAEQKLHISRPNYDIRSYGLYRNGILRLPKRSA